MNIYRELIVSDIVIRVFHTFTHFIVTIIVWVRYTYDVGILITSLIVEETDLQRDWGNFPYRAATKWQSQGTGIEPLTAVPVLITIMRRCSIFSPKVQGKKDGIGTEISGYLDSRPNSLWALCVTLDKLFLLYAIHFPYLRLVGHRQISKTPFSAKILQALRVLL